MGLTRESVALCLVMQIAPVGLEAPGQAPGRVQVLDQALAQEALLELGERPVPPETGGLPVANALRVVVSVVLFMARRNVQGSVVFRGEYGVGML
jgi:hypothetical protein